MLHTVPASAGHFGAALRATLISLRCFLDSLTDEEYYALEAEGNLGDEDEEAGDGTRMDMDGDAVDVVGRETNVRGEDEGEGELRADEANDAEEE